VFSIELRELLYKSGVIAVLVIDDAKHAVPLAEVLLEGGVDVMELTLRTDAALPALKEIRTKVPEMTAGVGTVLNPDQVVKIHRAGAVFGVAPGLNPHVVTKAQEIGLPFAPGIATPTEIETALSLGCKTLKFFPAEPMGGLSYFNSMINPYHFLELQYIPLGGLNQSNFADYLKHPAIPAVGGSWIAKRDTIQAEDWKTIKENANRAIQVVRQIRG